MILNPHTVSGLIVPDPTLSKIWTISKYSPDLSPVSRTASPPTDDDSMVTNYAANIMCNFQDAHHDESYEATSEDTLAVRACARKLAPETERAATLARVRFGQP